MLSEAKHLAIERAAIEYPLAEMLRRGSGARWAMTTSGSAGRASERLSMTEADRVMTRW